MTARGPAAGLIIAAPASGSGKTVVTLGLLRGLARTGTAVVGVKAGPDYIDPAFHAAATGRPCPNLDPWAMRPETLAGLLRRLEDGAELIVCEGVMGLFDGAPGGDGSTADLAARTGWPVVLVVDVGGQGASAVAVVEGFARFRDDVKVAAVVFNRVGGPGHEMVLRATMAARLPAMPVLGCLSRNPDLALPERHLGLVQAGEHAALETFLEQAADAIMAALDLATLRRLARPTGTAHGAGDGDGDGGGDGDARDGNGDGGDPGPAAAPQILAPLGQRIAVAFDAAFGFAYASVLQGWRAAGAEVTLFSPLAGEGPDPEADAVYLPGGYPELMAGQLVSGGAPAALRAAAARGAAIFGECGGYMVLGRGIEDRAGHRFEMAGLLALETSFATPRLHLGYRRARLQADGPLGPAGTCFRGHEFHYATVLAQGPGAALFACEDAAGNTLGPAGLAEGRVMGSFVHLIDRAQA